MWRSCGQVIPPTPRRSRNSIHSHNWKLRLRSTGPSLPPPGTTTCGSTLLSALFSKTYIDPNRSLCDLDPDLLDGPWGFQPPLNPGPKSKLGLGLIRSLVRGPEEPIYGHKLAPNDVRHRIQHYYEPYHLTLATELRSLQEEFGQAVLLDAHSMKAHGNHTTPDGPGAVSGGCRVERGRWGGAVRRAG